MWNRIISFFNGFRHIIVTFFFSWLKEVAWSSSQIIQMTVVSPPLLLLLMMYFCCCCCFVVVVDAIVAVQTISISLHVSNNWRRFCCIYWNGLWNRIGRFFNRFWHLIVTFFFSLLKEVAWSSSQIVQVTIVPISVVVVDDVLL